MRDRVFGIETEYAVIYRPARGEEQWPSHLELYQRFEPLLARHLCGLPRAFSLLRSKPGWFLENGASFHYEATPRDFEHGLIEMASPECRDPFTLVAHERAKDLLVERICQEVNRGLAREGRGEVRIGKNNVDSQGHTFGSHESYWVEDPLSWAARVVLLPLWIVCWALTLPALAWLVGVALALATAGLMLLLVPTLVASLVSAAASLIRSPHWKDRGARLALRLSRVPVRVAERLHRDPGALPRQLAWIELPLRPALALHSALYNRFHFRRIHRYLTAFLVTRTLFTGGGAVALDGGPLARLAQRPPHMRAFARIFTSGDDRPLYESRDVFFRPWSALGSRRRLHLMLGDANLCDHALALRVGVTALVLEAIESGEERWPVLPRPLAALRALNQDPDLVRRHCLADGTQATALDVQRRYLQGVKRFLSSRGDRADRHEKDWRERILSIWEETLDLLEREPDALADRVDWIAKRALLLREIPEPEDRRALERRGGALVANPPPDDPEARRLRDLAFRALRVDLRYHELSARGGHRRLERRSRIQRLVSDAAVERALRQPPEDTRAWGRGGAIREACLANRSGGATWHRVRIGRRHWRFYADPLAPAATHTFG